MKPWKCLSGLVYKLIVYAWHDMDMFTDILHGHARTAHVYMSQHARIPSLHFTYPHFYSHLFGKYASKAVICPYLHKIALLRFFSKGKCSVVSENTFNFFPHHKKDIIHYSMVSPTLYI